MGIKRLGKEHKLPMKAVMMPLRYCLTGMEVGSNVGDNMEVLGKEKTLARIHSQLAH